MRVAVRAPRPIMNPPAHQPRAGCQSWATCQRVDGPLGTQQRFAVPGERWLEVTPDQMQGTSVRMRVRLLRGERPEMNANILAAPGAPAVLGGPPYGSGVLIIILWANPNP